MKTLNVLFGCALLFTFSCKARQSTDADVSGGERQPEDSAIMKILEKDLVLDKIMIERKFLTKNLTSLKAQNALRSLVSTKFVEAALELDSAYAQFLLHDRKLRNALSNPVWSKVDAAISGPKTLMTLYMANEIFGTDGDSIAEQAYKILTASSNSYYTPAVSPANALAKMDFVGVVVGGQQYVVIATKHLPSLIKATSSAQEAEQKLQSRIDGMNRYLKILPNSDAKAARSILAAKIQGLRPLPLESPMFKVFAELTKKSFAQSSRSSQSSPSREWTSADGEQLRNYWIKTSDTLPE
jgi:hypothetical protein